MQKVLSLGGKFALEETAPRNLLVEAVEAMPKTWSKGIGPMPEFRRERNVSIIKSMIETSSPEEVAPSSISRVVANGIRFIQDQGWIVKEADKNLGLVLMSPSVYQDLLASQVSEGVFAKVTGFPHGAVLSNLTQILNFCSIPKREGLGIYESACSHTKPAPFYVLPKIHKPTLKARPITAQHSYMLSHLSKKLTNVLNEVVIRLPAITINSRQVVNQLEHVRLPQDVVFLTYDVESLYPSIDIPDALRTLRDALPEIFLKRKGFWLRALELIMTNNYVKVGDDVYKQITGTATGTAVAPPFANLYLFYKFRETFRTFSRDIIYQRRYIDDGLILLRNGKNIQALLDQLKSTSGLSFTHEESTSQAIFLDLRIYKGERFRRSRILDTEVYTKPISKFLYLHGKSNHPRHVFTGIVKGEMIRFLRNTSSEVIWLKKIKFLFEKLSHRGYTRKYLRDAYSCITFSDRHLYLQIVDRPANLDSFVVTGYHASIRNRWISLRKWATFYFKNKDVQVIEKWPRQLIYRRSETVARNLISSKVTRG